jgi:hypothetical protein
MEKLQLKYLAHYLPYKLKIRVRLNRFSCGAGGKLYTDKNVELTYKNITKFEPMKHYNNIKLILKPLTDLTASELENQGYWHHIDWLTCGLQTSKRNKGLKGLEKHINDAPYEMIVYLLSKHYDVFGLIDKGLAVSYSDIQSSSNEG